MRKEEETTKKLAVLAFSTEVSHATRVNTPQLKHVFTVHCFQPNLCEGNSTPLAKRCARMVELSCFTQQFLGAHAPRPFQLVYAYTLTHHNAFTNLQPPACMNIQHCNTPLQLWAH